MVRRLRKLAKISASEWLLLPQLIFFSLGAAAVLKLAGLSRLVGLMTQCAVLRRLSIFPLLHRRHEIARLTTLVELATRITHGQKRCLPRSLLMFWLLKARGEPARLLLGVSKIASTIESHAWIEVKGKVVVDSPEMTGHFATILRL